MICGLSYVMLIRTAFNSTKTTIGMIIVSSGYALLACGLLYNAIYPQNDEADETVEKPRITPSVYLTMTGALCLAMFFIVIHFDHGFTFHLRYYDVFAAFGYMTYFILPSNIFTHLNIIVYYVLGAFAKIGEPGIVSLLQLVGRSLLVVYHSISVSD